MVFKKQDGRAWTGLGQMAGYFEKMNFRIPYNAGNFITNLGNISVF